MANTNKQAGTKNKPGFANLKESKIACLTTYKRDGSGVSTPIGFGLAAGKLYFLTPSDTWKVKRLRNNPSVTLAPCTYRGQTTGPAVGGKARLLKGAEAQQAKKRIYATMPIRWPIIGLFQKLRGLIQTFYEVTPGA